MALIKPPLCAQWCNKRSYLTMTTPVWLPATFKESEPPDLPVYMKCLKKCAHAQELERSPTYWKTRTICDGEGSKAACHASWGFCDRRKWHTGITRYSRLYQTLTTRRPIFSHFLLFRQCISVHESLMEWKFHAEDSLNPFIYDATENTHAKQHTSK